MCQPCVCVSRTAAEGVRLSVCMCMCEKEQAIYSLCIPGDLSLKLHIHDTSLWGLEGHHQIEGAYVSGHTLTHTHTENTHLHTLSAAVSPWKAQHTHFPGSSALICQRGAFISKHAHKKMIRMERTLLMREHSGCFVYH